MERRLALLVPLLAALGCGGAPPEAAAPPQPTGGAEAKKDADKPAEAAASAAPSATAAADAPKPPPEKATVVDAPLGGALTQNDIARILEKQGALFNECYTIGAGSAAKAKDYRATVTVKATLGPTGTVNSAEVLKSTAKNPKVDACVRDAFKKVKFPPPKNGGTSVITFPINFAGSEQVQ